MDRIVCADCGLEVGQNAYQIWLHIEEPRVKNWISHEVRQQQTRAEYEEEIQTPADAPKPPAYRQAEALERIAASLESIDSKLRAWWSDPS